MPNYNTMTLDEIDAAMAALRARRKALKASGTTAQRKILVLARRRERLMQRGSMHWISRLTAFSGKLGTALSDLAGHLSKLFQTIPGRPLAVYDPRQHQYRAVIRLSWEPGYRKRKAQAYRIRAR